VETFEQVMNVLEQSVDPLEVYVVGTCPVPAGVFEMRFSFFNTLNLGDPKANTVDVADGGQLRNLSRISGSLVLQSNSTGLPAWDNDSSTPGGPRVYAVDRAANIGTNTGGGPVIVIPGADFAIVGLFGPIASVNVGGGASSAVQVGAGTSVLALCFNGAAFSTDWISGPASAVLNYVQDGSLLFPAIPNFLGTVVNSAFGRVGGSGETALRPAAGLFGPVLPGTMYFDTDLVPPRPVWWNAVLTSFVDAAGAPA